MLNNRTPMWTILGNLTKLFQPLMFAEGDPAPATPTEPVTPPAEPPATPPTEPPATPPVEPTNWRSGLPDDIKDHASLSTFKSVGDLAKSHLEAQKLIGAKGVILPGKDATEEQMDTFYNSLGRPDKVEGYKIDQLQVPEGVKIDENVRSEFLKVGHKLGLLPHQVNGLIKWQLEGEGVRAKATSEADKTSREEAETNLRKEWGTAYDANIDAAKKLIAKFADDSEVAALDQGLGNDPRLIKMMAKIAKGFSEDTLGEGVAIMTKTPTEAQAEIAKIRADKNHPYFIKENPEHESAVKYMQALYDMAHPNEKK
jgi:hypothetical protein